MSSRQLNRTLKIKNDGADGRLEVSSNEFFYSLFPAHRLVADIISARSSRWPNRGEERARDGLVSEE
jgi:hypothetical protein